MGARRFERRAGDNESAAIICVRRGLRDDFAMNEPLIRCPHCQTDIKLTESLVAPMVASVRRDYEQRLAARAAQFRDQEAALQQARADLEATLVERVAAKRKEIVAEEQTKARLAFALELRERDSELSDLKTLLQQREEKLGEAQRLRADLLRRERALEDANRELELTVEKRVQKNLEAIRAQSLKDAEESMQLKIAEKEHTISAMRRQIEALKQKAEQGSQQLQGEVQELALEALLCSRFPQDEILAVPKGEHGGDVLQRVMNHANRSCGVILWESKRTKNWNDAWLAKLRADQRLAKAEIAAIVSQTLPREVETFAEIEGIWVMHPRVVFPVAATLRRVLSEVDLARQAGMGQQSKADLVYQYLTGPQFRQRVQAIVEAFATMQEDLEKERRVITRQWTKRQVQIERVMEATVGMYGDLQGIAGKSLEELEGLAWQVLEQDAADD